MRQNLISIALHLGTAFAFTACAILCSPVGGTSFHAVGGDASREPRSWQDDMNQRWNQAQADCSHDALWLHLRPRGPVSAHLAAAGRV